MKISISFPPLESTKGVPLLSQNRQFQWFSDPTYIYPMIPASAATLLKQNGYEVFWDDAIAEGLSYDQWLERIEKENPDIIAIETKTPVIKRHWKIINDLKNSEIQSRLSQAKFILMGDHVSALPEESLENSKVDFVLTGGDYDYNLLELLKNLENLSSPAVFRNSQQLPLDDLPMIDRKLTKWENYAYQNGNYKYTPGSYVMSARDCWWGKCAFCSWTTMFPGENFRVRSASKALDEIGELIKMGVKEIMEDSGTLPVGEWLEYFCRGMVERGYNKKVVLDCNMRLNAIKDPKTWQLMKTAGFRMILFGVESANQKTLDQIDKNLKVEEIEPAFKMCKEAGLEPHATFMLGWPWETKREAMNTVSLARRLFKNSLIDSLQATLAIPYPGTPLYKYCQENNLLLIEDYDRFDQREPVMRSDLSESDLKKMIGQMYRSFITPKFFLKKAKSVRSLDDLKFFTRAGKKFLGHLRDFS